MNNIFKTIFLFIISVNCFSQELKVFEIDSLFGYKNDAEIIIKPQYQYANEFVDNKAIVYKNNKAGVINTNNKLIIPFEYDKIYFFNDSLIYVKNRTKYSHEYNCGVLSKNNSEILPLNFSKIYLKDEKLFVEKRKDSLISKTRFTDTRSIKKTYGIYNLNGNPILEPIYDWFKKIGSDTLRVSKGQYYAMVKSNGEFLTNLKYTAFGDFHNNRAAVRIDSSYGFIDKSGYEVIKAETGNNHLVSINAGYGKNSHSYLKIENLNGKFYLENFEELEKQKLESGKKTINDILILETETKGISRINKVYWSISEGIIKYETKKGNIWELKNE